MNNAIPLLQHECPICYVIIDTKAACSSCCITLYHKSCLDKAKQYSAICPTCGKDYLIIDESKYLTARTHDINFLQNLYQKLYRINPIQLNILDHNIRAAREDYYSIYHGYFPLELFITREESAWRSHSYGIFDGLIWNNIIAVGFGVTFDSIDDVGPIEFIIYDDDCRIVRSTLMYLLDFIAIRLDTDVFIARISADRNLGGRIQILIPGIMKPIIVSLSYKKDIYNVMKHRTDGIFYQNGKRYTSIKYLTEPSKVLYETFYIMKYDGTTTGKFKETMTPEVFFAHDFPLYKLHIQLKRDNISQVVIKKILSEINIIAIEYEVATEQEISLRSSNKYIRYHGIVSHKNIYEFITNNIYKTV